MIYICILVILVHKKTLTQTPRELKEELEIRSHGFSHFVFLRWCCLDAKSCPTLRPHGLQGKHARLPCPSLSPRVRSDSCPLSRWCHPAISPSVTPFSFAFNLSQHEGLFQWVSSLHQVAKILEFQLQHQSFQWMFRVDFRISLQFDLLAVQRALKILLQCHNAKASILWHLAFFTFQLSHLSMTMDARKNHSFDYVCFLIVLIIKVILISKMLVLTIDEHKEKG